MKITGLHALTHSDDKEHVIYCAICDTAITHNLTPTITPDFSYFEIKSINFYVQKEVAINNCDIVYNNTILRELFSRPPPFLV
ncbi:hypothetical protein [Polaribacter sp. KT25b]|uniref:hypothetical protein n=1 Tax=Polaribacter sp. KT25b TaxID=1855336 RepID=UPI000B85C8E8|nr:hypothetical protein [Polaribacter sp. KT25b]